MIPVSEVCVFFFGSVVWLFFFFFFQAEDGIRDATVTGVQTCALPIFPPVCTTVTTTVLLAAGVSLHSARCHVRQAQHLDSTPVLQPVFHLATLILTPANHFGHPVIHCLLTSTETCGEHQHPTVPNGII